MSFENDMVQLLEAGIKKAGSAIALGRIIKVANTSITRWRKDATQVNMKAAIALADYVGVRLNFPEDWEESYVRIASDGTFGAFPVLTGMFSLKLLQSMKLEASDCVYLKAIDNSMDPVISNGDAILVNTKDTDLADGAIFLLSFNENVFVRRTFPNYVDGIVLRCDNAFFPQINIARENIPQLKVLGRVRWVSKIF